MSDVLFVVAVKGWTAPLKFYVDQSNVEFVREALLGSGIAQFVAKDTPDGPVRQYNIRTKQVPVFTVSFDMMQAANETSKQDSEVKFVAGDKVRIKEGFDVWFLNISNIEGMRSLLDGRVGVVLEYAPWIRTYDGMVTLSFGDDVPNKLIPIEWLEKVNDATT